MSVFVVSTPLQLLNAIEARHALLAVGVEAELWVVCKHPGHRFTWLCAREIAQSTFSRIRLLELNRVSARLGVWGVLRGLLGNRLRLRSLPREYPACRHMFIGNPRTPEHLYLASLFAQASLTCLDDGTGTVSFYEQVAARGGQNGGGFSLHGNALALLKDCCFRSFYGDYRAPLRRAEAFTAFVESAAKAGFATTANSYAWLKGRMRSKGPRQGTHFLGAPFVDRGELSWEVYKGWLQRLVGLLPGPLLYVGHWAESDAQLQRIESELGIRCKRFERPYELEYLLGERAPACVASWFSSALDVLAVVSDEDVRLMALEVPLDGFLKADIAASASAFYARHREASSPVEVVR
ncbi:hypothetical protein [Pseudomonas sp. NCCP-436]|uniref:hypothetical protein n=1 Tax=Pseudomonas sp. NCCP-436 TaxID=2842481 RepID=UPI001C7EE882|nr:hypothetical protein [Pseudomonas sp. NCCP-436]GIZ11937.1 hypothetical protein NCCP436_13530 [Pseudomonas sp. NCCP-436]